ncbi:cyclin-dependent kinase 2-interacting protein [Aplochiton taeniatus]
MEVTHQGRKSAVTGSARKIKDNAADWHNLILKWDKLNDEGSAVANKIVNLGLIKQDSQREQHMVMEDLASASSLIIGRPPDHSRELEEECIKLVTIVDNMTRVVSKMAKLVSSERGVVELETFQYRAEGRPPPLFLTWTTAQFAELSSKLYEAFSIELSLKKAILQELAHTTNSDLCLVYLSCWLHQPYIDHDIKLLQEGLLLETGHRTL